MIRYIRGNFFNATLFVIILLVVGSFAFTVYNRQVMIHNTELKHETEAVKENFNFIFSNTLQLIDLGLRGYVLTGNEQLLSPYNRSEEHTSELQSRENLVCRLLLEKKKNKDK